MKVLPSSHAVRNWMETVAIVAAGVWAFYIFIYTDRIKPQQEPPRGLVALSMERAGSNGDFIAVRVSARLQNIGAPRVRILSVEYRIDGARIEATSHGGKPSATFSGDSWVYRADYTYASMRPVYARLDMYSGTRPGVSSYNYINSGGIYEDHFVIYARKGRFDVLRGMMHVYYTKQDARSIPFAVVRNADGMKEAIPRQPEDCGIEETDRCPASSSLSDAELPLW